MFCGLDASTWAQLYWVQPPKTPIYRHSAPNIKNRGSEKPDPITFPKLDCDEHLGCKCYKFVKQLAARSSLVHAREQGVILSVYCQDLMPLIAVESSHFNWGRANGRLAGASGADAFVAARLVDEDELAGSKLRDLVEVVTLKIRILFPCHLPSGLLRPLDRRQRPAYACLRHLNAELVEHEASRLVLIQSWFCEKLSAKSTEHVRRHGPTPIHPGQGSLSIIVAVHVLPRPLDHALTKADSGGHLGGSELSVLNHSSDLSMLGSGELGCHYSCSR
jgi:hypothetical protein